MTGRITPLDVLLYLAGLGLVLFLFVGGAAILYGMWVDALDRTCLVVS